jgi:tRNA(adenine34) deaminase
MCADRRSTGTANTDLAAEAVPTGIVRRTVLTCLAVAATPAVASLAAAPAAAGAVSVPGKPEDEGSMREAVALAAQAGFPLGAVIVRGRRVLARGLNLGKKLQDPTAHGEMVAMRRFLAERGPDELRGTTLYTSDEPCVMRMGAIVWCDISRVVYGASVAQLAARIGQTTEVAEMATFAWVEITGGVLADESMELFP